MVSAHWSACNSTKVQKSSSGMPNKKRKKGGPNKSVPLIIASIKNTDRKGERGGGRGESGAG